MNKNKVNLSQKKNHFKNLLKLKLDKNKRYIEKELLNLFSKIEAPKVLKEVMKYAVLNGGKRIRPFIIAEVAELYSVSSSLYRFPAMAIEMAHSFSLIYDDLPCMDNDDLRRGKPSVHIQFNQANALLGGASLLTHSYNILSSKNFLIDEKKKILLLEKFSDAIGHNGMLAGQFMDIEAESPKFKLNLKNLSKIQSKKTGLLIAFCCYAGGILGNAKKSELSVLLDFGMILGRLFQITDDLLDKEGNQKNLGKRVNKDEKQNKATIIRVRGVNYAKLELKKLSDEAKDKLSNIKQNTNTLFDLIDYISSRTS